MISFIKKTGLFAVFGLWASAAAAQGRPDTLSSFVIEGVGSYKPTITDANKISDNPEVRDSTKKIPVGPYSIDSKRINTPFSVDPIIPAQISGEPLTKLYNGLVKVGLGNYNTPYGEVWYNHLRSKEIAYGIRLKHLSSSPKYKDYENSGLFSKPSFKNYGYAGYSENEVSLYGKKFLKEHTLSGDFDYARDVFHYYGYDASINKLEKDQTVQRFNLFAAGAELKSHYPKPERINHDIRLSYYNLMDLYKSSENNIKANGSVQTAVSGETLKINALVDYYNYKTQSDTTDNTIVALNPNFIATGNKYRASLGVTAAMDIQGKSKFYFYPNVELSYNIFEEIIIPYAGVTGGLKKNSFRSVTDENPFVKSELTVSNTNTKYEFFGGLKGTLSSKIAYSTRVSYADVQNMLMYVNDMSDVLANKFDVIFDDAEVLNIRGEVSYQNREKLRFNLKGEYFNYKMENELRAWFKPQVEITLSANYNMKDKIVVKADLFYIDSQFAKIIERDPNGITADKIIAKEVKGVFDANLGVEYRYTKKLGFFLNFNNIASQGYNRWYKYPTQRFGIMGGLSYSF
ncbi:MAG TPA: hypothetical protein VF868_12815 [Bacteroidia bacterium]